MPSGHSGNDNTPEKKTSNVEDDMSSMPKPSGLKGSLRSTCPTSAETGVQVDQLPEQWVGAGAHILTGSNLYRKNILDFHNSGATLGTHDIWSFFILLRRDFATRREAAIGVIFSR